MPTSNINNRALKISIRKQGFSIVEVLITIVIITMLLMGGFASYESFNRTQDLISAKRQMISDLRVIQKQASIGNKPSGCTGTLDYYYITISSPRTYTVYVFCKDPDVSTYIKTVALRADGVTMAFNPAASVSDIRFLVLDRGTNINPAYSGSVIILSQATTGKNLPVYINSVGSIK